LPQALPDVLPWSPGFRLSWKDPSALGRDLDQAVAGFSRAVAESGRPWMVLWCSGVGVVGTPAEAMDLETRTLEMFLERLGGGLGRSRGTIFFAGSAGGAYAGCGETPMTEATPPMPTSDYGRAKLRQEETLRRWAESRPEVSTLSGRISNLYGPGQNLEKPQGLISHLSRCLLHQIPAHVFAPLDTLRDHLFAPDAADRILACMDRLRSLPPPIRATKIIASGTTTSIGAILAIFGRISRRKPRIICSGSPLGRLQPTRLALRSVFWEDLRFPMPTSLAAGIHAVHRHHLQLFQAGLLPPLPTRGLA
jgi:UDP-glucose 4-epimerase